MLTKITILILLAGLFGAPLLAQTGRQSDPKVNIAFNRYYDHAEIGDLLRRMEKAWPEFLSLSSIGKSHEGRDIWLMTIQNKKTGAEFEKAAMYIDGNIHGNEVQASEVCIYTIWYLMENYGKLEEVTKVVDERVFYIAPSVNPDGRDYWFHRANTSSSSRSGTQPTDNDGDGLFDEDGPEDLDGDGSITRMRKKVAKGGTHKLDPEDPRFMIRVKAGEEGDYILLGSEGIDNDADGRKNEDGIGGYDMNRNNPTDWQPNYIQRGAGWYPFSKNEPRAVGAFVKAHPNIAAGQSYHNSGGMILRGPGNAKIPEYPRGDLAVYDEIGRKGERILPFYRYMIIHKDLYNVHGGFVNFLAEGLGIVSFTNELWSNPRYFMSKDRKPDDRKAFNDLVMLGGFYKNWSPFTHPEYGEIEIGGWNKWSSRQNPGFTLEETCHRNCAFSLLHAKEMPLVVMDDHKIEALGDGLFRVRVTLKNERLIPSRTAHASKYKCGLPDFVELRGGRVVAAGRVTGRYPNERIVPIEKDLARVRLESGIGSKAKVTVEWIVEGRAPYEVEFRSQKGGAIRRSLKIP
ncbi:MAG: M14 family metallopeptidase [Planctomycetota bacterium]